MRVDTALETLNSIAQARTAKPGKYRVQDAAGLIPNVVFRKAADLTGSGAFNLRYHGAAGRREMSLGLLSTFSSFADVRKLARKRLAERDGGDDPLQARRAKKAEERNRRKPVTVREAAKATFDAHSPRWRGRYYAAAWQSELERYAFPIVGKLDVNDVTPQHVATVMHAAIQAGFVTVARTVQGKLEMIFNGAIARGERDFRFSNPANRKMMKVIIPTQHEAKHFRRIELPEASAVFRKIWDWAEMAGGVGAGGAELDVWLVMVLTASRPGETIKMLWPWVNFEKR